MVTQIKLRRDTAANWILNSSVVLAAGEPGFETDTGKLKIGNGTATWDQLGYSGGSSSDRLVNGSYSVILGSDGNLTLPEGGSIYGLFTIGDEGANVQVDHATEQVYIRSFLEGSSSPKEWTFGSDGNLELPSVTTIDPNQQSIWTITPQPALLITDGYTIISLGTDTRYFVVQQTNSDYPPLTVGQRIYATGFPYPVFIVEVLANPGHSDQWLVRQNNFLASSITEFPLPLTVEYFTDSLYVGTTGGGGFTIRNTPDGQAVILSMANGDYAFSSTTITLPGGIALSTENGLVAPEGGYSELADYDLNNYVGADANTVTIGTNYNNSANLWTFDLDGNLTLPLSTKLNSGGISVTNSVEFGTTVATNPFPPNQGVANITNSEIYMSGGSAEARIITDAATGSLIYTGVEHVEVPAFAGMVAVDPDVTSQYSIDVDPDGRIVIGATQEEGTLTTTNYTVGLGALNSSYTINGLLANPGGTFITGLYGISMTTERGQVLFGGQPEECAPGLVSHFHIMKGNNYTVSTDLFFGDDYNYVKLPGADYIGSPDNPYTPIDDSRNFGVEIATLDIAAVDFQQYKWRFNTVGGLEFPDNSVQTTAWDYRNLENINMDGGAASAVYTVDVKFAEGGYASTRFSKNDANYMGDSASGSMGYDYTLDGGRA
jgi:hypothetical protein